MSTVILIDKSVRQADFFDESGRIRNLGRVVRPLVCTCTKELGGTFELYAEFVDPDDDTADCLSGDNYIVAPVLGKWDSSGKATRKQQIFFIESAEKTTDESGIVYIKAYAKQAFYKLSSRQMLKSYWDQWLAGFDFPCDAALRQFANTGVWAFEVGATDIYDRKKFPYESTVSYVGAIMDETGIIRHYGAELHRDNFYFSGKKQKEFSSGSASEPAFRFFAGKEISGITETIDYTGVVTALNVVLTNGYTRRLYVKPERIGLADGIEAFYESSAETDVERMAEAAAYFETVNHPQVAYVIQINALKKSGLYKDISGLVNCDIGDVGIVESRSLRISTAQKVTRTVEDVLAGEYTEIILGNIPGSIARAVNNTVVIGAETSELDVSGCAGFTADITVAGGKNRILLQGYEPDGNSSGYDVYVDTGDLYTAVLSEYSNRTLAHIYPFDGSYTLSYHAFGTAQSDRISGIAIQGAVGATSVHIDNVVFNSSTAQIGTRVTINSGGYPDYTPLLPSCATITNITIPDSVRYISPFAFVGCLGLTDVYFGGSIDEWLNIQTASDPDGDGWQSVYNITVHCSNGDTIQPGNLGERS